MKEIYVKITGFNQTFKLIEKSALPGHKTQLVVDDLENNRYVFTKQSGCYKIVPKPKEELALNVTFAVEYERPLVIITTLRICPAYVLAT